MLNIPIRNREIKFAPSSVTRVGIYGGLGSFHHMAAELFFASKDNQILALNSFPDLFFDLANRSIDYAMAAVENTIAGLIHTNYQLLHKYNMVVVGEQCLPVTHCLLALKNTRLENVKEVHSQPMAILQCGNFLNKLREKGVRIVESNGTGWSAKEIAERALKDIAVIGGSHAAIKYGLNILQSNIESEANNATRFLCIANKSDSSVEHSCACGPVKAMLSISIKELRVQLPRLLKLFTEYGIEVKLLLPINNVKNKTYDYIIEVIAANAERVPEVVNMVNNAWNTLKIKGIYELHR